MANTRISDLTASASNLASTDLAPVVQTVGVGPVKMTGAQIAAGLLSATTPIGSGPILSRGGSATLQLGAADAAAPVAQTFKVQSVVAGTSNTAGANFTIQGSQGTGTGAGGSIIFQVAPAGSTGTAQNAYQTAFQINGNGGVTGQDGVTANTLALRNGTNAQRFNVYNTYTSSTNYETFKIDWITTANTCLIGTEKGSGGGTARALALQTDGTTRLTIGANGNITFNPTYVFFTMGTGDRPVLINGSGVTVGGSARYFGLDNSTTAGDTPDTRIYRIGAGILGVRGSSSTTGGALSLIEQTAPTAPAANGVYIYAEDNGSGKTRLMALFATGAAQQIAIEP